MKYAIISDIHSNLEALMQAFEIIDARSVDEIICLGDIVGYGANPNECIHLVRQRCSIVIKGNHDEAVLNPNITQRFTDNARAAIFWTLKHISEEHVAYLQTLPLTAKKNDLLFVHASPSLPDQWMYILEEATAQYALQSFSEPICFHGHTHAPMIFSPNGQEQSIIRGQRYLVNVGSIGQPRDQIADLSFGIFDTESWTYENIRSPYDIETAVQKILDSGLPPRLGYRLRSGV